MQRGPPVPARGGLPVELLGLGQQCDTVVSAALALAHGLAVKRTRQPVRRLPVPALRRGPHPVPGCGVPTVLQQIRERVGAQGVPLFGGLAQPVLGGGLVAALAVVPAQGVRGRCGPGDGGDPPPAGGLVGVSALMKKNSEIVGGGAVARGGGGTQMVLGSVEITAAQQHGPEDAHRLDIAGLGGEPLTNFLDGLLSHLPRFDGFGRLHKSPCLEQSCLVPHNVHRRTTCNLGTPGIPQPVRSLQRFVDMPTERQVKHSSLNSPWWRGHPTDRHIRSHKTKARILMDPGLRLQ